MTTISIYVNRLETIVDVASVEERKEETLTDNVAAWEWAERKICDESMEMQ